jgi:hypothetical protein
MISVAISRISSKSLILPAAVDVAVVEADLDGVGLGGFEPAEHLVDLNVAVQLRAAGEFRAAQVADKVADALRESLLFGFQFADLCCESVDVIHGCITNYGGRGQGRAEGDLTLRIAGAGEPYLEAAPLRELALAHSHFVPWQVDPCAEVDEVRRADSENRAEPPV